MLCSRMTGDTLWKRGDQMAREPDTIAAQRRVLGERLAVFRKAAGLTQAQLARLTVCDRTAVAHAERGHNRPDEKFWLAADEACQAGGSLLSAFHELETARHEHERQRREHELAEVQAKATRLRRQPLQPAASVAAVPSAAPEPSGVPAKPRHEGALGLAAVEAMAGAFQVADRQVGGGQLYPSVLDYLQREIAPRLFDADTTVRATDVFAAAASLTEVAGWMAHDGGHDQRARRHFSQAYRLAAAAQSAPLAGNLCASMSHLAGQLGETDAAVRIANTGLRHSYKAKSMQLTARLHTMRARGLAMSGDRRSCVEALEQAKHALDQVDTDQPMKWVSPFDEASLASEAALCFRQLGVLREAERQARRVVELRVGDRVRSRAFGQITLARVLVDEHQVEEAAAIGREVCLAAQSLTSARVVARLGSLAEALRPHAAVVEVQMFLEDCSTVSQTSPSEADEASWPV
jgi:transcriptional regulator with XRE-family HTH domain